MALNFPFTGTETLAKEPLDEQLMDQKVRQNLEGLDTRVTALEGGGSGIGAGGSVVCCAGSGAVTAGSGVCCAGWGSMFGA